MSQNKNIPKNIEVPPEFYKIMKDFLNDILTTFPEYEEAITDEENLILSGDISSNALFMYCCDVYPSRFFDILYENEELFTDKNKNTKFFENIDFKDIWKENISDNHLPKY